MTSARKTANNKSQETERTPQELQRTLTHVSPSDPRPRNPSQNAPHTKRRTVHNTVTKMLPLKAVPNDTTQADPQQITRAFPDIHHCPAQQSPPKTRTDRQHATNQAGKPANGHLPDPSALRGRPTPRLTHVFQRKPMPIHGMSKGSSCSALPRQMAVLGVDWTLME
jgi:hypothetical protein